jgi:aromatic ring-opening dioxygenase catalytic subunit (LigB family)
VSGKSEYTKLLYDYGGFPDYTYKLEYRAPAEPNLAKRITEMLQSKGIGSELDKNRNWDHGVFIPLKVMYPEANIPVVEVFLCFIILFLLYLTTMAGFYSLIV